jgi:uncharacterized protein
MNTVARMKPWYLGMWLMDREYERLGILSRYGIDNHFARRAWLDDKPVRGLEKAARTVAALGDLSDAAQDTNLAETLRTIARVPQMYASLTGAWRRGEEKEALRILRPANYTRDETWQRVVADRNAAWLPKLEEAGGGPPALIITGLDHLIGPEGLPRQLAARGWQVAAVRG